MSPNIKNLNEEDIGLLKKLARKNLLQLAEEIYPKQVVEEFFKKEEKEGITIFVQDFDGTWFSIRPENPKSWIRFLKKEGFKVIEGIAGKYFKNGVEIPCVQCGKFSRCPEKKVSTKLNNWVKTQVNTNQISFAVKKKNVVTVKLISIWPTKMARELDVAELTLGKYALDEMIEIIPQSKSRGHNGHVYKRPSMKSPYELEAGEEITFNRDAEKRQYRVRTTKSRVSYWLRIADKGQNVRIKNPGLFSKKQIYTVIWVE